MKKHEFGPMDHLSLLKASQEAPVVEPPRELGKGFVSARTAVNVHTTVLHALQRRWVRFHLFVIKTLLSTVDRQITMLGELRAATISWLTTPSHVEAGKEQALENELRSTKERLHPRYGMMGALQRWLVKLRFLLYFVQAAFDLPYLFGFFVAAFNGPSNPGWEDLANPAVISAILLAIIPTLVLMWATEATAPIAAARLHAKSKDHANEHGKVDLYVGVGLVLVLSVTLTLIATSRFTGVAFQANAGGKEVGIFMIAILPLLIYAIVTLSHNPRRIEAAQRAAFDRTLTKKQVRAKRLQDGIVRTILDAMNRLKIRFARIQAELDRIGAVADQQVTWTAIQTGAYGISAPDWQQTRTLSTNGASEVVEPAWGVPTTVVTQLAAYKAPQLYEALARYESVRDRLCEQRDVQGLYDVFRASPETFMPSKNPGQAHLSALGPLLLENKEGSAAPVTALNDDGVPQVPAELSPSDQVGEEPVYRQDDDEILEPADR